MQEKYYSELNEIPLYNFEKCLEGDYRFVCKNKPEKWGVDEVEAFGIIYEKYVQKYQKKELDSQFKLLQSIVILQDMYVQTGDEYFITQAEIKRAQLPKAQEKQERDTTSTLIVLSKWMGFRLNPREISVDEFYSIVQNYERANKKK
jgi:predicted metal-dependent TIM-barrel fold hydrolase